MAAEAGVMHGLGTLLGAALGFLASLAPQIWAFIVAKWGPPAPDETAKYALLQAQQDTIAKQQETISKLTADYHYPLLMSFIKGLQTSVRPTLTYAIFGVWATIKLMSLYHGLHTERVPTLILLPTLWDEDAESLFAAIVCFWFGSRQMNGTAKHQPRTKK